jgi:hypothetical protein
MMRGLVAVVVSVAAAAALQAQVAMPDPREMAGIPRPVTDLPEGSVSVRLIRGELSNNIGNHPVSLEVNGQARTVNTDEAGRAQFDGLPPGATLRAVAVVDGERLESQQFPSPSRGGIRVMLVATDREREARAAEAAKAPAVEGQVAIGGETRFVVEMDDERVRVFYLLEIINDAQRPVATAQPIVFDAPTGALSTTVMEGAPQATAVGPRVFIEGPFPPGGTFVQVGFALPSPGGAVEIEQRFPVELRRFGVIVEKGGEARLSSSQIERQQEMPADGRLYIAAAGGAVPAGQPLVLNIDGLPHHSPLPRRIALALAGSIVLAGVWALRRPSSAGTTPASDRKRLVARKEKALQELARLDADLQRGRIDASRHAQRRPGLVAQLEDVYRALDVDPPSPDPSGQTDRAV